MYCVVFLGAANIEATGCGHATSAISKIRNSTAYTVKGKALPSFTLICTTNGTPYAIYVNGVRRHFAIMISKCSLRCFYLGR